MALTCQRPESTLVKSKHIHNEINLMKIKMDRTITCPLSSC